MATTHPQRVIDAHCHIGDIPPWKFYDLEHPVKPTVYTYATPDEFVKKHMDEFKIERALAMSNYGVPVHEVSFDLNDVVMEAATTNDRILAAIWVSFLPRNAEMTRKALKLASESRVVALKTTFLLGGNPDPNSWDDETRAIADECFDVCEQHDLIFHFHTSPGGSSDISNFIPLVERYGQRCKIYLVHFGGGVSGHIRLVPKFLQWVRDGYKVYTDTSWAIGFGARWLLTEVENQGVGGDRVFFGSDEPWSDFDSEYWKINGIRTISQELKERVFWRNYEELYAGRG
jgi:predicted TIM-barrel fold metal-dependent hydrolase